MAYLNTAAVLQFFGGDMGFLVGGMHNSDLGIAIRRRTALQTEKKATSVVQYALMSIHLIMISVLFRNKTWGNEKWNMRSTTPSFEMPRSR